ncbi:MAG: ABC transporter ATP-binding protein [Thermodesulfovibrio sp.]|nr:ABC transporter ATP-binding protein [Thermodesulfovibrio sp.]
MPEIAISVKNVSKKYRLYDTPKDRLREALNPFRKKYHRDFWALQDISFEIAKGETVGIIGRNGSGKSTLLQIICGILQPTEGAVSVRGRISALLELGSGFNPEFTGKQNVYMNGALLGLTNEEVAERFDAIAEFADIGGFIDQPVKTYSSGMYVRLAFASAIHVDPDILIIDEALAVGDEAFQRKCFSRLHRMQEDNRTILFVSHSASMVVELCKTALLFDHGKMHLRGTPKHVVSLYHRLIYGPQDKIRGLLDTLGGDISRNGMSITPQNATETVQSGQDGQAYYDPKLLPQSTIAYESRGVTICCPQITTNGGDVVNVLVHGDEYLYSFEVHFEEAAQKVRFGILFKTTTGLGLGGMSSHEPHKGVPSIDRGARLRLQFRFKCSFLPGVYFLNSGVMGVIDSAEVFLHRIVDICMFRVQRAENFVATGIIDFSVNSTGPEITAVNARETATDV